MMEESSEAHMETDVSSTTLDVLETEEVTASNGNVEMIIVVEKVDNDTCSLTKELSQTEIILDELVTKTPEKVQVHTPTRTPTKDEVKVSNKSPQKVEQVKKNITLDEIPMETEETVDTVDSSCKPTTTDEQTVESDKDITVSTSLPVSEVKSPIKMPLVTQLCEVDKEKEISLSEIVVEQSDSTNDIISNKKEGDTEEMKILSTASLDPNCEKSNDSQMETCSDSSEKDHIKSISRELKSLINSAKESKIISECTQLTSKTRKSRGLLDGSNTSLNSTIEADKIQGNRRSSNNSQKSNCSEKSEKITKRSMRSQNPEFVNKVKQFFNSISGKVQKSEAEGPQSDEEVEDTKSKEKEPNETGSTPKKKKQAEVSLPATPEKKHKLRSDMYCWRCHWPVDQAANEKAHPPLHCTVCPRSFHYKCISGPERSKLNAEKNWVCPECLSVLHAESSETRSPAMKKISLGLLCELLKYALERMMDLNGVEPFMNPVDRTAFPDYDKYVVHPMDLSLMKVNIVEGLYGSTEAFLGDTQWILHNSIIFNTMQSKLTAAARALVRSCRTEMSEIEACAECYAGAHARKPTWFTDVCTTPHILLWAKLKGFPYWPAKGMSVNSSGLVDVRFFGAHDRAWVPARDCFLYSEKDPNNFRTKRQDILDSMQEAEQHIRNISRKYGKFVYPPFKTQFDATKLTEQLKMMIPSFEGEVRTQSKEKHSNSSPNSVKEKRRSNSKSSKSSLNDGDVSEAEDANTTTRKMADGAEIAREEDYSVEKNIKMGVDLQNKENEPSRKRRRSELVEAVCTIMEMCKEKKKRPEDKQNNSKVSDHHENEKVITHSENKIDKSEKTIEKMDATTSEKDILKETPSDADKPAAESTPIKLIIKPRSTPKVTKDGSEKSTTRKQRPSRSEKSSSSDKDKQEDKSKPHRRRSSKNKSMNSSNIVKEKQENSSSKEKAKDKNKESETDKNAPKPSASDNSKPMKERLNFDDDTSLAVIAREASKSTGLPTISSVRSLSTVAQSTESTTNKTTTAKMVEVTVEANSDSSIFTPTSTDNVRNMKEAVCKLQKLRSDAEPSLVGRVGVRAFARITSAEKEQEKQNELVQVEIKAEPMDFEDADRQMEKLDLMNSFHLRPVNPPVTTSANLREVRINKVVVAPVNARKSGKTEVRMRAKKTFPQPKKPDDGRSELNSKNSMVYIPIQPPVTQAPVRASRPLTVNGSATMPRPVPPLCSSAPNSIVNTMTTPLVPVTSSTPTVMTNVTPPIQTVSTVPTVPTVGQVSTIGHVPTTVHTVPLITSVNGQWTFSLQPIMSVGGVDDGPTPPMVNGLAERPGGAMGPSQTTVPAIGPSLNASSSAPASVNASGSAGASPRTDNNTPGEPPRLQQKPLLNPFDVNTPIGSVPPPSTAGPITAKLNQNAVKLTDFFRSLLVESIERLEEPATHATALKLQLEQARWRHQQEIDEVKHNHDLTIAEMRASFEKEKAWAVSEARRTAQVELEAAVKAAKTKQWCANCGQEAQFYCCWNTSYCDYPCQRAHWAHHHSACTQLRNHENNGNDSSSSTLDNRLQPAPDNMPALQKNVGITMATSRIAPARVYAQDSSAPKPSIIVSMVEDGNGSSAVKCLGTFKPPGQQQISPLIINKQILNDENAKKVVTSGGYLIVGASAANNSTLVTTSRRTHAIQYYT